MKPRKNPTDAQMVRRQQREPIGPKDPRASNDPYWALRLQGYSDQCAKRAFRDIPPRYYKEELRVSEEYIADVDPEDLLFIPSVATDRQVLAVLERPDLTEETVATAPPRAMEYTIWSEIPHGFGLRIRPSGARSYIVMFRIKGNKRQYKLTLGKVGDFPLELARKLAREARIEASVGNDPRPMHKRGQLLRQVHQSERVLDGFPHVAPEKQGNALPSETIAKENSRPQAMPMDCKQERNIQRDTYAAEIDPDTEI